jgi:tetratricopeptide (TPR) repeat protein
MPTVKVVATPSKGDGMPESVQEAVRTHLDHGRACLDTGKYDDAIADYDKAIALDPNYATAYSNRGIVYHKQSEFDRAIADFTKAIALNPKDAAAYNNRGNAYKNKDDLDRAVADYDKAIKLNPKLALAYYNRGLAYEQKAQGFQLPDSYSGATDRLGRFTEGFLLRRLQGDKEQAVADFRKALEIDPSHQPARKSLKNLGVTP